MSSSTATVQGQGHSAQCNIAKICLWAITFHSILKAILQVLIYMALYDKSYLGFKKNYDFR